jgi:hypothetical protein
MESSERACKGCRAELGEFEGNIIPTYRNATASFNMPSGGFDLYCDVCYKDFTGDSFVEQVQKEDSEKVDLIKKLETHRKVYSRIARIQDVNVGDRVQILGVCDSIVQKTIKKNNQELQLMKCLIDDGTQAIPLVIWNQQAKNIGSNKVYKVNGFVTEFQGQKQLTLGFHGTIEEI